MADALSLAFFVLTPPPLGKINHPMHLVLEIKNVP
jgi:hypothetical protein